MLEVRVEKELYIIGAIAKDAVEIAIEKRARQHKVVLFQGLLEFITGNELFIDSEFVHIFTVQNLINNRRILCNRAITTLLLCKLTIIVSK